MSAENKDVSGVMAGVMGAAISVSFCSIGAAYGTARAGTGIAAMAIMRPDLIMKSIVPVVMAGIIGIYGLVVSVLLIGKINPQQFSAYEGYMTLGAGLSVGLAGMASGFAIGVVGESCVRAVSQQPKLFIGMILILIFAEVLALYGLITSIYLYTNF